MGDHIYTPVMQVFDDNGAPGVGYKLYTYEAGTTTPKAVYTDKDCTVAATNPVVFDSRGEAEIYYADTYKFVLTTDADATVWTVDNVGVAATSSSSTSYYYYPDPDETDQGVTASGSGDTIYDIITSVGTTKKATIWLRHTGVALSTNYVFDTSLDLSLYSNIVLMFDNGARLTRSTGDETVTLYNSDCIRAGRQTVTAVDMLRFSNGGIFLPEWWGATGNGTDYDTSAIQYAIDIVTYSESVLSLRPEATYLINASIEIDNDQWEGKWKILGNNSTIEQATNDTPVLEFVGGDTDSFEIKNIALKYTNQQTTSHTESCAIYFNPGNDKQFYNSRITDIRILNAYRGISVSESGAWEIAVWGCEFSRINTWKCSGSSIFIKSPSAVGMPRNVIMDVYVNGRDMNMSEQVILLAAQTQFYMTNVELNEVDMTDFHSAIYLSSVRGYIGNIKAESCEFADSSSSANRFIYNGAGQGLTIEQLQLNGNTVDVGAGNDFHVISSDGTCDISHIYITDITNTSGNVYVLGGLGPYNVEFISKTGTGFVLSDLSSQSTADNTIVKQYINNHISDDNGDADLTIEAGDATVQMFETALTADRAVTVPDAYDSDAFNGMEYTIVRTGGGAFDLDVDVDGGGTVATIASGSTGSVTVKYRRHEWVLVSQETW